jgi:hypothetical protein
VTESRGHQSGRVQGQSAVADQAKLDRPQPGILNPAGAQLGGQPVQQLQLPVFQRRGRQADRFTGDLAGAAFGDGGLQALHPFAEGFGRMRQPGKIAQHDGFPDRLGLSAELFVDQLHEVPDLGQAFEFGVLELDAEFTLHGDHEADMAEAIPFLDILGGGVFVDLDVLDIKGVFHDVGKLLEGGRGGHSTSISLASG